METVDKNIGLTQAQVEERVQQGEVNTSTISSNRTNKDIIIHNSMTIFNLLNVILFVLVLFTGSFKNVLFIFSVAFNTGIGIFQEIKAKNTIEKLSILKQDKVTVIREGKEQKIAREEIVKGDILCLKKGMQVPVDVICLEEGLMVDESLLTGESDFIEKAKSDLIYSGSLVMQGTGKVSAHLVGDSTYVSKLTSEAKTLEVAKSKIQENINKILKWIAIIIVPLSILVFINQSTFFKVIGKENAILGMVAAIIGVMPEGLVLLVSVALAAGVLKLSTMGTLTQELPAIETLARVDTICLDKTGTITEGKMSVEDILYYDENHANIDEMIALIASLDEEQNMSAVALQEKFHDVPKNIDVLEHVPFSSELKLQAMTVKNQGTYILGAFDMVVPEISPEIKGEIDRYLQDGYRILGLSFSLDGIKDKNVPKETARLLALICIKDVVKEDAREIIHYFKEQGVDVKIISGDYPDTIAAIAKDVGIEGKAVISADIPEDIEALQEMVKDTSIFGRVTPPQKRDIMQALQKNGNTVSMVGDGINDILALKQSDCAIAFGNGSEATKAVAQFVLLENDFSSLPNVVKEGRKVINNINTVAGLHIVRVVYSFVLALALFFFDISFPLDPINLTLVGSLTVGIPTSLLIFEKNEQKAKDNFFRNIWLNAVPCGVVIALTILFFMWIFRGDHLMQGGFMGIQGVPHYAELTWFDEIVKTFCTFVIGCVQLFLLLLMCRPLTKFRISIVFLTAVAFIGSYFIPPLAHMFGLASFTSLGRELCVYFVVIAVLNIFLVLLVRFILAKTIFSESK